MCGSSARGGLQTAHASFSPDRRRPEPARKALPRACLRCARRAARTPRREPRAQARCVRWPLRRRRQLLPRFRVRVRHVTESSSQAQAAFGYRSSRPAGVQTRFRFAREERKRPRRHARRLPLVEAVRTSGPAGVPDAEARSERRWPGGLHTSVIHVATLGAEELLWRHGRRVGTSSLKRSYVPGSRGVCVIGSRTGNPNTSDQRWTRPSYVWKSMTPRGRAVAKGIASIGLRLRPLTRPSRIRARASSATASKNSGTADCLPLDRG
jgi:hypothetical protein